MDRTAVRLLEIEVTVCPAPEKGSLLKLQVLQKKKVLAIDEIHQEEKYGERLNRKCINCASLFRYAQATVL